MTPEHTSDISMTSDVMWRLTSGIQHCLLLSSSVIILTLILSDYFDCCMVRVTLNP